MHARACVLPKPCPIKLIELTLLCQRGMVTAIWETDSEWQKP
jgi:hypothetical protein